MELRHLRYFVAVAERQSFTQAAKSVHVTQSTLSHQIKQLEQELGFALFERTLRSVSLTHKGAALLPAVIHALRELDEGVRAAKAIDAHTPDRISIVIGAHTFASVLLPDCLEQFTDRYPGICVHVQEVVSSQVRGEMADPDIDLAIGGDDGADVDFMFEPLYFEELILLVGRDHPLANRRRLRLSELHGVKLALVSREFVARQTFDRLLAEVGAQPRIVAEYANPQMLANLAATTSIACITTRNAAQGRLSDLAAISLEDPTPKRTIGLLWRNDREPSPAARLFADVVRQAVRSPGPTTPDWLKLEPCDEVRARRA